MAMFFVPQSVKILFPVTESPRWYSAFAAIANAHSIAVKTDLDFILVPFVRGSDGVRPRRAPAKALPLVRLRSYGNRS